MSGLLDTLFFALLVIISIACWLIRFCWVKREARRVGNGWVVEYGWKMRATTVLITCDGLIVIYFLTSALREKTVIVGISIVLLLVIAIVMNMEFFGVRIFYDDYGLETRTRWGQKRKIPWKAIRTLSYRPMRKRFELTTDGYGVVRINDNFAGRKSLIEELENHGVVIQGVERPLD